MWTCTLSFFGYTPRNGIAGWHDNFMVNLQRNCWIFSKVVQYFVIQLAIFKVFSFFMSPSTLAIFCIVHYGHSASAAAKSLQSCLTLCDPIDGSPPSSTIPGILQARTLEWVAISFSNAWKQKVKVKMLSLHNPMDCSLPGSSVHGIFQARVLEWGAIAFSAIFPRYMEIRHRVQWLWWTCLGTWTKVLS